MTLILAVLLGLLFFIQAAAFGQGSESPDTATIYTNATVLTMDTEHAQADGVRVENGRITHVFDGSPPSDLVGDVIDLEGATILPGLTDAHLHLRGLGRAARQVDLVGTGSVDEILVLIGAAVSDTPEGTWIRGRGWDQNDWEQTTFPDHLSLDTVSPDHPAWLTRIDGHAIWVNSVALTMAGIDSSTVDPPGGELLRFDSGNPTGVLVDSAIDLMGGLLPEPTLAEVQQDLALGIELCQQVGLTSVHDMGTSSLVQTALQVMENEGELTLRVTSYLEGMGTDLEELVSSDPDTEGLFRVVGVKLYADGALGSRGAALLAPYSDRPDSTGLLVVSEDELATLAQTVHQHGFQLAIHAIGDRGNRVALNAIEFAQGDDTSRRHRVEHAQVIDPGDQLRFDDLGIIASMQPTHATSDMPWAEDRLGSERIAGAYAWRSLIEAGANLAFGSDAPVESVNPWLGIYAAVTRQDAEGQPNRGWRPQEALTVQEALLAFTLWPARATGDEQGGQIRPGAIADLTIVDRDPTQIPPNELNQIQTLRTIVDGVEVFRLGDDRQ